MSTKIGISMEARIGETAGKLWKMLHDRGKVSISQLPKLLDERDLIVYQALGWLARESKVTYITEGSRTFIELKA